MKTVVVDGPQGGAASQSQRGHCPCPRLLWVHRQRPPLGFQLVREQQRPAASARRQLIWHKINSVAKTDQFKNMATGFPPISVRMASMNLQSHLDVLYCTQAFV